MATNKQKSPNLAAIMYTGSGALLAARDAFAAQTDREASIRALGREQVVVMETLHKKAAIGAGKIKVLHENGAEAFQEMADHHGQLTDKTQDTTYGHYVREYNERDLEQAAKHISGAVEVGSYVIAQIIAASVVPEDELEEPEKPGFFRRLIGEY